MAFQSNDHHAVGLALNLKAECHKESQKSQHDSRSSQPREKMCAKMEQQYVHDVYNKTAHHFTDVKYKAWPKVKQFLLNLAPGSIVADVGCGSGKYLNINKDIIIIGCDHSSGLANMAERVGRNVLVCDNLYLPFREQSFDAVISVSVIHHFTTPSRRAKAIRELSRVLRPGGKVMIYVWAMEQKHRKFKSQDVLVPWHLKLKLHKQANNKSHHKKMVTNDVSHFPPEDSDVGDDDVFESEDAGLPSDHQNKKCSLANEKSHSLASRCFDDRPVAKSRKGILSNKENKYFLTKHFGIGKKLASPEVSEISAQSDRVISSSTFWSNSGCDNLNLKKDTDGEDSLTKVIKSKFLNLIGFESNVSKEQTDPGAARPHLKMIEEIINSDHELCCQIGENIPFYLAVEGFAVREFPGSSQRKDHLDIKCTSNVELCDADLIPSDNATSRNSVRAATTCKLADDLLRESNGSETLVSSHPKHKVTTDVLNIRGNQSKAKVNDAMNCRSEHENFDWLPLSVNNQKNGSSSFIGEMFPFGDNNDWAKLTAKAIEHVQNRMTASNATPCIQVKSKRSSPNSHCLCKGNIRVGDHSADGMNGKSAPKNWNCSESSLSSISSDTDSNASDIEDVSLCAVCRGDSVSDVCHVDPELNSDRSSCADLSSANVRSKHFADQNKRRTPVSHGHIDNMTARFDQMVSKSDQDHLVEGMHHFKNSSMTKDAGPGSSHDDQQSFCSGQLNSEQNCRGSTNNNGLIIQTDSDRQRSSSELGKHSFFQPPNSDIPDVKAGLVNIKVCKESRQITDNLSVRDPFITCPDSSNKRLSTDSPSPLQSKKFESSLVTDGHNTTSQSIDGAHKRFYHVFRQRELDELIAKRVHSLRIVQSFYDHANWCVVAEKLSASET
ncbi:hypothetical protein LSH36_44g01069 [Paralvinella palmiformis]|uniref:Methyltransferase type 11 domain-containing protein n=1 Tax=Paralvinella palmiformis TaxID=53620 RepID=A0AAD9K6P4_9ANNE|nr:hypothetical protein LSH36_44g01069 [Paralvinella palmiformis]